MSELVKKKRIFYFDALRALAILSVIFVHVFMVMRVSLTGDISQVIISKRWLLTAFVINFFRIGVPLFLMLSGALSLGRDWTIKSFLGKRIPV